MLLALGNLSNNSTTVWALLESAVILVAPLIYLARKFKTIENQLSRINYAIWNDGKTGMKNVIDEVIPALREDVTIIKTKIGV